jgi:hypothetical protein
MARGLQTHGLQIRERRLADCGDEPPRHRALADRDRAPDPTS